MTKDDLIAFRKRFNLSKKTAAAALGCSARAIYNYEVVGNPIPKSIALAASAFAMGLPPYGEKVK
jgi:DNA-binding XRE family transcriptional regulator